MSDEKKRPAAQLRDGNLKAAIWENTKDDRTMHSVQFSRSYQDKDGNFRDTQSFSSQDLLRLSHLAGRAHDRVNRLRAEMRSIANAKEDRSRDRERDQGYER